MTRALLLALLLASTAAFAAGPASHVTPAEADSLFGRANEACLKDDFKACIEGYEQLVASGFGGADLSYNLGTAYLKQGKLGLAVLHLERAVRDDPTDQDARANLEKAHRMRVDRLVGAPEETTGEEPLPSRIASRTRADSYGLAFLVLWLLGGFALVLRRLVASLERRAGMLALGLLALLAALPCGVVLACHAYVREEAHEAVVVAPSVPVREGPKDSFKTSFEVHEGLKVRVVDEEAGFKRVKLANGLEGWVPSAEVLEITPG